MAEETRADEPVAAEPDVTAFPEPERFLLHMPVDVRNVSLVVLAIMASLFVLQWARVVLIPIMLSVLFSYAFSPLVNWLENRRVPRYPAHTTMPGRQGGSAASRHPPPWRAPPRPAQRADPLGGSSPPHSRPPDAEKSNTTVLPIAYICSRL